MVSLETAFCAARGTGIHHRDTEAVRGTENIRVVARIYPTPDDAKLSRLAAVKFGESFRGKVVEFAFSHVVLELAIPNLPVVLREPVAKRRQLFGSQLFDFTFESFHLGHRVQFKTARILQPRRDASRGCGHV
jgi:hypothetical protein